MAGHSSNKDQKKRNKNDKSNTNINNVDLEHPQQLPLIDIDEIAKAKIITAADLHRTNDNDEVLNGGSAKTQDIGESIYADFADDNEQFNAHVDLTEQFATNSVKWTIRVQAFKLVHRLIQMFVDKSANTPQLKSAVLKILPDLIRLSFVAATSPYDELKIQGFEMFRYLIVRFAQVEEKEFVGHSILEQYKTQVLSAIKPAFDQDAPPYITAIASQICSLWICQGLEKDPNDVRRTHQLMSLSIDKLENQSTNQNSKLYTESELEQERVDILGSWAQLYLASNELKLHPSGHTFNLTQQECNELHSLVRLQVEQIIDKWWEALKDYALLIMPAPRLIGTNSHDNDNVYTREVALRLFEPNWPKLILAATIWLCREDNSVTTPKDDQSPKSHKRDYDEKYAKFILGIIMKELCRQQVYNKSARLPSSTIYAVRALNYLQSHEHFKSIIIDDMQIAQEFYTSLYAITVSYSRDPQRQLLRNTLDSMFSLILNKIKQYVECLHYGLVRLIGQSMIAMKDTEIAVKHKDGVLDINEMHVHFSIRLHNLSSLIKVDPEHAFNEPQLQEAIIIVFQELLRFDLEPNYVLASIEQLNDLYRIVPKDKRNYFIDNITKELSARASTLFKDLYHGEFSKSDKLLLSVWDSTIKSLRNAIVLSEATDRSYLIDRYVLALIENIDSKEDLAGPEKLKRKRDLLDASLNLINSLNKLIQVDDIDSILSEHVKEKLSIVNKLRDETKSKLELKNTQKRSQNPSMKLSSKMTGSSARPQASKITLKADFSNFYTKKS